MPVFTIQESVDPLLFGSGFAYEETDRMGNPSQLAFIYRGYAVDEHGTRIDDGGEWVIKAPRDRRDYPRVEREYRILTALHRAAQAQFGLSGSPFPVYLLTEIKTAMPALAMPLYRGTVYEAIPAWFADEDEDQVLAVMIAYAHLLSALKTVTLPGDPAVGYAVEDRKVDDLFWDQGRLVVIDWNAILPATPAAARTEISRFARTWYTLLTGYEITPSTNPYNDDEWKLASTRLAKGSRSQPFSVGLRAIVGAANVGIYHSMDELSADLDHWRAELGRGQFEHAFPYLSLSPERTRAVAADLAWRRDRDSRTWDERAAALSVAQAQTEALADLRPALDAIERLFLNEDDDGVKARVAALRPVNALQRAAKARWEHMLSAYMGSGVNHEQRQLLHARRAEMHKIVSRLQRPLNVDHSAESEYPLEQAAQEFGALLAQMPPESEVTAALTALANEITLRQRWHEAQYQAAAHPNALVDALNAGASVPYAPDLLEGIDLDGAFEQQQAAQRVQHTLDVETAAARAALIAWMQSVLDGSPPTVSTAALRQQWQTVYHRLGVQNADLARDFAARTRRFDEALATLDWLPADTINAVSAAYHGSLLLETLRDDLDLADPVKKAVQGIVTRKAEAELRAASERIDGLRKRDGAGAFFEAHTAIANLTRVKAWLPDEVVGRIRSRLGELQPLHEFYKAFESSPPRTPHEIIAYAQQLKLPIEKPPISDYIPAALNEGIQFRTLLQEQITASEARQGDKLKLVEGDLRPRVDDLEKRLKTVSTTAQTAHSEITAEKGAKAAADAAANRITPLETQIAALTGTDVPALKAQQAHAAKQARRLLPLALGALVIGAVGLIAGIIGLLSANSARTDAQAWTADLAAELRVTDAAFERVSGDEQASADAQATRVDVQMDAQALLITTLQADVTRMSATLSSVDSRIQAAEITPEAAPMAEATISPLEAGAAWRLIMADANGATYRYTDANSSEHTFAALSAPFPTQIVLITASQAFADAVNGALARRGSTAQIAPNTAYPAQIDENGRVIALHANGQRIAFVQWRVTPSIDSLRVRALPNRAGVILAGIDAADPATYPLTAAFADENLALLPGYTLDADRAINENVIAIADTVEGAQGHWVLVDRGAERSQDRFGWVFTTPSIVRLTLEQVSASAPTLNDTTHADQQP
jgi:hypothetical protein